MATEADRTTSVRGIKNPDDASMFVPLKVIDRISFIDNSDRGQETQWTLNNGSDDNRQVHVKAIDATDGASKLDAERIDVFSVKDDSDRGQETQYTLDSSEPPKHLASHEATVYSEDGGSWLKLKRTDKMAVVDKGGQETILELTWVDDDTANPPAPLPPPVTTWDGTDINPPWRIDPFQCIIDVSWGGKYLLVAHSGNKIAAWPMSKLASVAPMGAASYTATLTGSSWMNDRAGITRMALCQLKLSDVFAPIMAPFTVTAGAPDPVTGVKPLTITVTPKWQCFNMSGARKLSDGSAASSISNFTDAMQGSTVSGVQVEASDPIINGAGNKVYFCGETFTADTYGNVSVSSNSLAYETWRAIDYNDTGHTPTNQVPDFPTKTGDYYWGVKAINFGGGSLIISSGTGGYSWSDTIENNILSVWQNVVQTASWGDEFIPISPFGQEGSGPIILAFTIGPGDTAGIPAIGSTSYHSDGTLSGGGGGASGTSNYISNTSGDYSLSSCPILVFSQVGGFDKLDLQTIALSGSMLLDISQSATWTTPAHKTWTWDFDCSFSYSIAGFSGSNSIVTAGSGATLPNRFLDPEYVAISYFPYPTGTTAGHGVWAGQYVSHTSTYNISTAFGPATYTTTSTWGWTPWLHCSNGAHHIQAATLHNQYPHIFLDGADWGSTLAAAVGVSLDNIDWMLMDVSLSDIKALK
jgi:hypothetical protein